MSAEDQLVPGPTRYMFTPAEAVSARPSVPHGVVDPSGGPGESTIGSAGRPSSRIAPARSNVVVADAAPARKAARPLAASTVAKTTRKPVPLNTPDPFPLMTAAPGYPGKS